MVARYKEFWNLLVLLVLVVLQCVFLKTIDEIGHFWVKIGHEYAQTKGISDETIYRSKTHEDFVRTGSLLAVFAVASSIECYLLSKRLRTGAQWKLATWVFVLAMLPVVFIVGRALLFLQRQGRLL